MIGGGCKCIMCDFLTCLHTIILTDWDNIAGISKTDISFVWELSLDWPVCRVQISVQEWPCQSCLCCCIEGTSFGRFFRLQFLIRYIALLRVVPSGQGSCYKWGMGKVPMYAAFPCLQGEVVSRIWTHSQADSK